MTIYHNKTEAIARLKERGYTHEFYLFETKLLWMQEKTFIPKEEFQIVESHCFRSGKRKGKDSFVFGITLKKYNVKGILLDDFKKYTAAVPIILKTKLNEVIPIFSPS